MASPQHVVPPLLPRRPAGLLFFRHGKNTTHFIDAWQKRLDSDEKVGGQQETEPGVLAVTAWPAS